MKVYQTNEIRNIALIGGAKSGKTTMAEGMLFEGGVISRKGCVEDKNTVSDYRDIEIEKQNSVHSTLMHTVFDGKKINIIDTPGKIAYSGDTISALHVADTALLVVNSQVGVISGTENAWRLAERANTPTAFVLNHLTHEKANFEESMTELKRYFGDKITAVQFPVNAGPDFDTIIDLILTKMIKYPKGGGKPEITEIPEEYAEQTEKLQLALIERAAEGDEALMEKYFETDTLTLDEMRQGVRLGLVQRAIFPVLCASVKEDIGTYRILDFVNHTCPSPVDVAGKETSEGKTLNCNEADHTAIFSWKTSIEPHLGEMSHIKVYGGKITEGQDLINARNGNKERISQLLVIAGKNREKVHEAIAGDIVATIKLKDVRTNDTLVDPKDNVGEISKINFPAPVYTTAVKAVESTDDEKMGSILHEMQKTDPSLKTGMSRELRQILIEGMGEAHINMVKWYFDKIHKIKIDLFTPRVPYRETITKPARADYRHKKQSGGSGQFGEVHMHIQPYFEGMTNPTDFSVRNTETHEMPWGGKLIFNSCIVGGSIDARFMPAILKGIMDCMDRGPLTGSYARDIAVYIYDGKMHPVDSNEISFKLAGKYAFSEAFKNAGPKIMEPIYDVIVRVPEEMMGSAMTDLQGRRAIIMGMDSDGMYQIIKAKVPLAEMDKYATSLSSITQGRGTYTMTYGEYSQVPSDVQDKLLKAYAASLEEED
ncbi:MAG: elongation factor G [Bacteroidales bacterium]|nr:elongation factor G [Bacteroidales bacterium]